MSGLRRTYAFSIRGLILPMLLMTLLGGAASFVPGIASAQTKTVGMPEMPDLVAES